MSSILRSLSSPRVQVWLMLAVILVVMYTACHCTLGSREYFTEIPAGADARTAASVLKSNVQELITSLRSHKEALGTNQTILEQKKTELETTKSQLDAKIKELEDAGLSTTELQAQKAALEAELTEVKQTLAEAQTMLIQVNTEVTALTNAFEDLGNTYISATTIIQEPDGMTVAQCQTKCATDDLCQAYTAGNADGRDQCFLIKSTPTNVTTNNALKSWMKNKFNRPIRYGFVVSSTVTPIATSTWALTPAKDVGDNLIVSDAVAKAEQYAVNQNITYKTLSVTFESEHYAYRYRYYDTLIPDSQLVPQSRCAVKYKA